MSDACQLQVGRTDTGYMIRVCGHGTCRDSAVVQAFATQSYRLEDCSIAIDFSECVYLDSTFLGCLVDLYKRFGLGHPSRFVVVASPENCRRLLSPSRLDTLLEVTSKPPELNGTLLNLSSEPTDPKELARHVMECHRILGDLDVPQRAAFAAVADQIERELSAADKSNPSQAARRS